MILSQELKTYRQLIYEVVPGERPVIMLDLDSVLVDLQAGVSKLTGGMDMAAWKARGKSMTNKKGQVPKEVSNNELHRMVAAEGAKFWAELPWMKDGKKLWNFVKKYDVHILSAYKKPSNDPKGFSRKGKEIWVAKNLRIAPAKVHLVFREDKQKYTKVDGNPALLIDDYDKNIREFNAKGGLGIVHRTASGTISQLKKLGF